MKTFKLKNRVKQASLMVFGIAFLTTGSLAYAQDAGAGVAPPTQNNNKASFRHFLKAHPEFKGKADQNGDGKLDKVERRQAKVALREKREDKWSENHPNAAENLDKNDDGNIDRKEWKQGKRFKNWADINNDGKVGPKERQRVQNFQDKADTNGDGVLNHVEKRRGIKIDHEIREDKWSQNHPHAAQKIDRNNDGDINRKEWKRANKIRNHVDKNNDGRVGPKERGHAQKMYKRADRNNDGHVNKREIKRAQHVMQNNRGGNRGGQPRNAQPAQQREPRR